jgi:hypothetical protein
MTGAGFGDLCHERSALVGYGEHSHRYTIAKSRSIIPMPATWSVTIRIVDMVIVNMLIRLRHTALDVVVMCY